MKGADAKIHRPFLAALGSLAPPGHVCSTPAPGTIIEDPAGSNSPASDS